MTDTIAKIAQATLDGDIGIRTADAEELHKVEGKHRIAIVEIESFRFSHELDGGPIVTCRLTRLELVPPGPPEDFARDYQRAIYLQRSPKPLDADLDAETVDQATQRGRAQLLCETCLHQRTDDRIDHWKADPDADGAFCTWKDTGEEVQAGDRQPEPATAP